MIKIKDKDLCADIIRFFSGLAEKTKQA